MFLIYFGTYNYQEITRITRAPDNVLKVPLDGKVGEFRRSKTRPIVRDQGICQ